MADDTLRLLHFADLHLGVQSGGRIDPSTGLNRRIVDVCDRLDELCATAEDEDVHAVLFAGDAFNNQHPNPTLQSLFAERVRRLARNGCSVFLLIGNHDLPRMASLHHPFSIYGALEVDGVVVGDRADVYRLPLRGAPASELQVAALPHFSRQSAMARLEKSIDEINKDVERRIRHLGGSIDPTVPSVFVGHCHVQQADIGDGQHYFGISEVEVSLSSLTSGQPFPYYALGHVHKRQVLATDPFVAYPGSLERVDFGEGAIVDVPAGGATKLTGAEPKGFYRFDLTAPDWSLAADPVFNAVDARTFVTVRLRDVDPDDPFTDVANRIERCRAGGAAFRDAFVRVVVHVDSADRRRLSSRDVSEVVPEAYDVQLVIESRAGSRVRDPRFAQRMSEADALDRYLESKAEWAQDRDELRRMGRDLIAEVLGT